MVDLFRFQKWDLVSHRGLYYLISGLMLAAGLAAFIINWETTGAGLNEGLDFKGGGLVTYNLTGHIPDNDSTRLTGVLIEKLKAAGIDNEVTVSPGAKDQILVRILLKTTPSGTSGNTSQNTQDTLIARYMKETINKTVMDLIQPYNVMTLKKGEAFEDHISRDAVDASVSARLKRGGFIAMLIGSSLILFWIWLRYNVGGFGFRYGAAGILALIHDLCTLVGMFAILHHYLQVNSPFIAALLTVLGYSIHDTIVIFDRIRENMRLRKGRTFAETVNISLLETMARSVNTILTVLFTLLALFFFGGPTLRDFIAAMLIGVTVGGYSSIFVASQLLVSWSKAKDKVILPAGEPVPAAAAVTRISKPTVVNVSAPVTAPLQPAADVTANKPDKSAAIQRARQAGKTARRRR